MKISSSVNVSHGRGKRNSDKFHQKAKHILCQHHLIMLIFLRIDETSKNQKAKFTLIKRMMVIEVRVIKE